MPGGGCQLVYNLPTIPNLHTTFTYCTASAKFDRSQPQLLVPSWSYRLPDLKPNESNLRIVVAVAQVS